MKKYKIVIVYWNPGNLFGGTITLHCVSDEVNPQSLGINNGLSLPRFFEAYSISPESAINLFPKHIVPYPWQRKTANWQNLQAWKKLSLPYQGESINRLARLIKLPITTFTFEAQNNQFLLQQLFKAQSN